MSAKYPSLSGKRVLVTGGASGIGESIVRSFCAQGSVVVFLDFNETAGRQISAETGALFVPLDLKQTKAVQDSLAYLQQARGFDALVNNAARDDRHAFETASDDDWDAIVASNLKHYFFVAQAVLPEMKKTGGAIVNISSVTALLGHVDLPIYAAAKGGCLSLTKSMARRFGEFDVRVNAVIPGWVKTERQQSLWITPDAERENLKNQSLKRWIEPQDIANMVIFLASDQARMCTGQSFVVDGGTT